MVVSGRLQFLFLLLFFQALVWGAVLLLKVGVLLASFLVLQL